MRLRRVQALSKALLAWTNMIRRSPRLQHLATSLPPPLVPYQTLAGPVPRPFSPHSVHLPCHKQHGHRIRCKHHPYFGTIPCLGCHSYSNTLFLSLTTTVTLLGYSTSAWQVQARSGLDQTSKVSGYWLKIWQALDLTGMVWERGRAPSVKGDGTFYDLVVLVKCTRWIV